MTATGPQADLYVTEIWCPPSDDGRRALHLPMREPEPLHAPEPETEIGT